MIEEDFFKMVDSCDLAGVQHALDNSLIDINIIDYDGFNLIFHTMNNNEIDCYKELVSIFLLTNIDVNFTDINGNTALHLAINYHTNDIATLILNHGNPNFNMLNNEGYTPLHIAVETNNLDMINQMFEFRDLIDVNIKDTPEGQTPLYTAVYNGQARIISAVLAFPGADINSVDKDNETILKAFYDEIDDEVTTLVLSIRDLNVNVSLDEDGNRLLHYALDNGYDLVARTLLGREDIDLTANLLGDTPLDIAREYNITEFIELIEKIELGRMQAARWSEEREAWISIVTREQITENQVAQENNSTRENKKLCLK
jgi:ankyrin repeat protein